MPLHFDATRTEEFCNIAHRVWSMESKHSGLSPYISPIRFASQFEDFGNGSLGPPADQADVWRLSAGCFEKRVETDALPELTIVDEFFTDTHTRQSFARVLHDKYIGMQILARKGEEPQPKRIPVKKVISLLDDGGSDTSMYNLLSMDSIVAAEEPLVTRLSRFGLLETVVCRLKARANLIRWHDVADKQVKPTPQDVASCLRFSILGFDGAFSGSHRDALGGTWLRSLFGIRLWWIVSDDQMTESDWKRFEQDGDKWDPGDKARAVVVRPGEVLVMARPIIHAVLTVETSAMSGGMFWDENDKASWLESLLYTAQHQRTTNEPVAYQLAATISELKTLIEARGDPEKTNVLTCIEKFAALGCDCNACTTSCPCRKAERRCIAWCKQHAALPDKRCMFE